MNSVSGCFGNDPTYEPIDTAADAAAVVDELAGQTVVPDAIDPTASAVVQMGVAYEGLCRRVQILTWAVALLALYVVINELKK